MIYFRVCRKTMYARRFSQLVCRPVNSRRIRWPHGPLARRACASTIAASTTENETLLRSTRNIGIIAHIDAGKTTTTERMLYYSGHTRRIGDVDDGSTVTDFLPAERARGITIQSAAITFHWPPLRQTGDQVGGSKAAACKGASDHESHTINLIDTPGHADFTFEVLRSLRVLDGSVCILDGVAGVEAQTEKVWQQAKTYDIPKIIYINKLDREGAAFGRTIKEIAVKLNVYPAVCQLPWFVGGQGEFCGVVDIVNLRALRWEGGDGKKIAVESLAGLETTEPKLAAEARKARTALVELLSEYDDQMIDAFLEANEDHLAVPAAVINASLRKSLLSSSSVVPVFAGASFRNIGVQPIIDAVTGLLPDPTETPDPFVQAGPVSGGLRELVQNKIPLEVVNESRQHRKAVPKKASSAQPAKLEACALAFKVVHHARRGVLVYVRVYHGALSKQSNLFNTNLQISERIPRLFRMYADDMVEVDSIDAGQIGVITGLKHARTGDTLVSYAGMNPKTGPPAPLNSLQLRPIEVPPPVFFASIEPHSLAEQKPTEEALTVLLREDPSLQLSVDGETGQTLLSGMGELHLEIARDRLVKEMKAKCSVGKIEISFRECLHAAGGPETVLFDREVAGRSARARCTARVEPRTHEEFVNDGSTPTQVSGSSESCEENAVHIDIRTADQGQDQTLADQSQADDIPESILPEGMDLAAVRQSLRNGALAALARGPHHAFPMNGVAVSLTVDPGQDFFGADTTASALAAAARGAVQKALRKSNDAAATGLMEPVMNVLITVTDETLGGVVHDLTSSRGGQIISLDEEAAEAAAASTGAHAQIGGSSRGDEVTAVDLRRVYAPPDPFDSAHLPELGEGAAAGAAAGALPGSARHDGNRPRTITAKVPLREMVGYLRHLRSLTKGRGTFVMSIDQFERMAANREKAVLRELRGGL